MADKMKCVIISGAPENDLDYYSNYIDKAYIICADSGYVKCRRFGIKPDLIAGDFDSSDYPDIDCDIIRLNPRKDVTDTFYCVMLAVDKGFREIIILGGIGSRFDHTYANVLSVNYCFEKNIKCALVNKNNYITILSGENRIEDRGFKYFSLFPFFEKCDGLSIKNAEYELDNVTIRPDEQYSLCNEFKTGKAEIFIKKGKIILILSND